MATDRSGWRPARGAAGGAYRGWGALIGLALATAACGPTARVADCRRISAVVNPALDAIEALDKAPEPTAGPGRPGKYARISAAYLALERRLRELVPPRDPEIAQLLVLYRQHLERAAQLTRQLAEVPAPPPARAATVERELATLSSRHRVTTRQLELACLGQR